MLVKARVAIALLLVATLSLPTRLRAEEKSTNQAAVQLGYEGLSFYQGGQWLEAYARFKRAYETAPSPVFLLYMARCQRNVGRLREAAAQLEQLLADAPTAPAPASWENALRDGRAELEALRGRIPSLRITGHGLVRVTLDDGLVNLDEVAYVNPGAHVVKAWSLDGRLILRSVELNEGERLPVALSFDVPRGTPLTSVAQPAPPRHELEARHGYPWSTAAWITGGVALGSAVVGTVAGLLAKSKVDAVRQHCDGSRCPVQYEQDAGQARTLANVSTAAFGIAGLQAVFTVTFVLLPNGGVRAR